ncbi:MAG: O-antigen ligase family protein, partial [Fibromonadaceae bacterium]|nr:O-antigen ligase family protein [Fibromonadaceae bacterium]
KEKAKIISSNPSFPLKKAFFCCALSISISSLLFSIAPIFQSSLTGYQEILNKFVFVYLLWRELKTPKDIQFFVKGLMIVFSIAVIYGFYERFNNFHNPLKEYSVSLNPDKEGLTFDYWVGNRAGTGRVVSIFNNALACSAYTGVALVFFYYINMRYKKIWNLPAWLKISFMCGLCFLLLFSNSRGGMLYAGLSMLFILKLKNILRLSLFLPFFVIIFYDWISPYTLTIASIVNPDASEAKGSNIGMRVMQFLAAIQVWESSPWFGHGLRGTSYWSAQRPELLGTESVWLKLPINQGLAGVLAQVYLYYSLIKLGVRNSNRYMVGTAFACVAIMTVTVGLNIAFFMCLFLVVYRLELFKNRSLRQ